MTSAYELGVSELYFAMTHPLPAEMVAEKGWAPDMLVTLYGERVWLRPVDGQVWGCCHDPAVSWCCPRHRVAGVDPDGCQHCGGPQRMHCQRWVESVGWHGWTAPTDRQRLARMLGRRNARRAA